MEVENDAISTNEAGIIASCPRCIAVWFAIYLVPWIYEGMKNNSMKNPKVISDFTTNDL